MGFKIGKRNDDHRTCPYCHERIGRREAVTCCESCGTRHHTECARELAGCPIMGCGGSFPAERIAAPVTVAPAAVAPTWRSSPWRSALGCFEIAWGILEIAELVVGIVSIFL